MMALHFTTISCLLRCPRLFDLLYIQKVEVLSKPVLYLGGSVHVALAQAYRAKIDGGVLGTEEVAQLFSNAWDKGAHLEDQDEYGPKEIDWRGEDKGQLKDTGIALIRRYWDIVQPKIEPLEVELSLSRTIDGVTLRGRLDLLLKDSSFVDYKTTARAYSASEVARNMQPTVYSLLLGGPARGAFHLMVKTKVPQALVVPFERTGRDLLWFRRYVLPGVVKMLQAGAFPANPTNFFCGEDCEVVYFCKGG